MISSRLKKLFFFIFIVAASYACTTTRKHVVSKPPNSSISKSGTVYKSLNAPLDISRRKLLLYAETFMGTPYRYGSSDPGRGFDCSGFVYHVLRHFHVNAPRVSYEYGSVGYKVKEARALPGDIILFTGESGKRIGHLGFVTHNINGQIQFIHAASARSGGVIKSDLKGYYRKHFVKVIRILK